MRVDVEAEFYVRVRQDKESVAMAASTLGRRTLEAQNLHGCCRASSKAPARRGRRDGHGRDAREPRCLCGARRSLAQEDLEKNGLELESVAIIDIDQTALEYFNPSNRFDAEGLTSLIKEIEERRKLRNDIEQDSMIKIRARNLEAEKKRSRSSARARGRLAQEREVEFRRAQQRAELARERAERETEAEAPDLCQRSDRKGPDRQ
jgi:uncharacterized membrane protein YqiK